MKTPSPHASPHDARPRVRRRRATTPGNYIGYKTLMEITECLRTIQVLMSQWADGTSLLHSCALHSSPDSACEHG